MRGEVRFSPSDLKQLPAASYRCWLLSNRSGGGGGQGGGGGAGGGGSGVGGATLRASSQSFELRGGALASVSPLAGLTTTDAPQAYSASASASAERAERSPRAAARPALPLGAGAAEGEPTQPAPSAGGATAGDERCLFEVPLVEVRDHGG